MYQLFQKQFHAREQRTCINFSGSIANPPVTKQI